MANIIELHLPPEQAQDEVALEAAVIAKSGTSRFRVLKRSLDARKGLRYLFRVETFSAEEEIPIAEVPSYQSVQGRPEVHIIGAGPAGLFAALQCVEYGLRPIVYERGKDVRSRRRDIAVLNKEGIVNEESNYCFGEGGAGAYSDGKLYTRSKKRGNVQRVLQTLVAHGASTEILLDAHPHIGTNKLPGIITAIRETIEEHGGEVRFGAKLTGVQVQGDDITSISINGGEEIKCNHLILATGHSARDIFHLLAENGIEIEQKPFALGVRVEHPQSLIDAVQYGKSERGEFLPPSSYSLVCQIDGRGMYSFCMCPGGIIAPCATAQEEIVTNGWSPSKRNNPYANSGIVVEVKEEDLEPFAAHGPLRGLAFQQSVERKAWEMGGRTQQAPAQRLKDFVHGKVSTDLPHNSYHPGTVSVDLAKVLPKRIHRTLQKGFKEFGKKMPGYLTNEAVVVATESRTSSPVRIPRDKTSLEHIRVKGLYPCGEGAGYAGGIVSAAIDGQRCVEKIWEKVSVD